MSLAEEDSWGFWLGDMPMPEGATREMMWAAVDALAEIEKKEDAAEGIAFHSKSLTHYEQRLAELKAKGEPTETVENIIEITEEILNTYREWLYD